MKQPAISLIPYSATSVKRGESLEVSLYDYATFDIQSSDIIDVKMLGLDRIGGKYDKGDLAISIEPDEKDEAGSYPCVFKFYNE